MIRLNPNLLLASIAFASACGKPDTTSSSDDRPKTTTPAGGTTTGGTTTGGATDGTMGNAGATGTDAGGMTGSTASTGMAGGMTGDAATTGGASTGMMAMQPTDPQIAHILTTANMGEIESANLALKKTKDPAVKTFAQQMVTDHTAANDKNKALATKLGMTPEDNETSMAMKKAHTDATAKLTPLEGAAFDKAYVDIAVQDHVTVLDAIDKALLPSAKNTELKAFVTEIRPTIAAHLEHAKTLQSKMTTAGGAAQ